MSDDQREEFQPRWQRNMGIKQLETAPFFVWHWGSRVYAAGETAEDAGDSGERLHRRRSYTITLGRAGEMDIIF